MSKPSDDFRFELTEDELIALIAAGDLVLTHRWLMTLTIPVAEKLLRSAVRKLDNLRAAVQLEVARQQRRSEKNGK